MGYIFKSENIDFIVLDTEISYRREVFRKIEVFYLIIRTVLKLNLKMLMNFINETRGDFKCLRIVLYCKEFISFKIKDMNGEYRGISSREIDSILIDRDE